MQGRIGMGLSCHSVKSLRRAGNQLVWNLEEGGVGELMRRLC